MNYCQVICHTKRHSPVKHIAFHYSECVAHGLWGRQNSLSRSQIQTTDSDYSNLLSGLATIFYVLLLFVLVDQFVDDTVSFDFDILSHQH